MGHSYYSDEAATRLRSVRSSMRDEEIFTVHHSVDKSLDPKGVTRVAHDSSAHPNSNPIAIMFDVTGSMGQIPKTFARDPNKLPGLMKLLITRGYVTDPQIMFGAVGDATTDKSPLQVGQFESGLEMDECLTKIHLEGGGGGQTHESYELALYFAARHIQTHAWDLRGKKPYLFTIGDEHAYKKVSKQQVEAIIGDKLEADITLEEMISEVNSKFEYFHIAVHSETYADGHHPWWKGLLHERALMLDDPNGVCELIGLTIGACEGRDLDDAARDLEEAGLSASAVSAAKKALIPYVGSGSRALRKGSVTGDLSPVDGGGTRRL